MLVELQKNFIPAESFYGVQMSEATLDVSDVTNTTVASFSLTGGTIVSGVSFKGFAYLARFDTSAVVGPYINVSWQGISATGQAIGPEIYKVPIIPPNYNICVEFEKDVLNTSGSVIIPKTGPYCYSVVYNPFYVPIDIFRQETYNLFEGDSDLDIARLIWNSSREADSETFCTVDPLSPYYPYLMYAKRKYALLKPIADAIQYLVAIAGDKKKRLADLEISVSTGMGRSSKDALVQMFKDLKDLRKVLNSCGEVSTGASLKPMVGRIADAYDRSVFGRYFDTTLLQSVDRPAGSIGGGYTIFPTNSNYGAVLSPALYNGASAPKSYNHLFTDPYSMFWVK